MHEKKYFINYNGFGKLKSGNYYNIHFSSEEEEEEEQSIFLNDTFEIVKILLNFTMNGKGFVF